MVSVILARMIRGAVTPRVPSRSTDHHLRMTAHGMRLERSVLGGNRVKFDAPIRRLGRDILVHGVPRHPLHIMRMVRNLTHACSTIDRVDARCIVGAAGEYVFARG